MSILMTPLGKINPCGWKCGCCVYEEDHFIGVSGTLRSEWTIATGSASPSHCLGKVASAAAMDALTPNPGDWCFRSDVPGVFQYVINGSTGAFQ